MRASGLETLGRNNPAIPWEMLRDLRQNGRTWAGDEPVLSGVVFQFLLGLGRPAAINSFY